MLILIDGHNLIPKIPGLSLSQPDDETKLIEMLQEYARYSRHHIHVFFDGAPAGHAKRRSAGTITVESVSARMTADDAIIGNLLKRKNKGSGIMVVSSDLHVQVQAKATGAKVTTSEVFVTTMTNAFMNQPRQIKLIGKQRLEKPLSEHEVSEWLDVFNSGPSTKYSK